MHPCKELQTREGEGAKSHVAAKWLNVTCLTKKSLVVGLCVAMTSLSIVKKALRDKGDVQVPL